MIVKHTTPFYEDMRPEYKPAKKQRCLETVLNSLKDIVVPGKKYTITITDREYDVGKPVLFREYECTIEVTECPNETQT